jgi:hypothetical protein
MRGGDYGGGYGVSGPSFRFFILRWMGFLEYHLYTQTNGICVGFSNLHQIFSVYSKHDWLAIDGISRKLLFSECLGYAELAMHLA